MVMIALKSFIRKFSSEAASNLVLRKVSSAKELDVITRRAIGEGLNIGPYDFQCAYASDPNGFYMCEVDGQVVSHIIATTYPNLHSHVGGLFVTEEYRKRGFGRRTAFAVLEDLNKYCTTLGGDINPELRSMYESAGAQTVWNTYTALADFDTIVKNIAETDLPLGIAAKYVDSKILDKILAYDTSVFGTQRQIFMEKWIGAPGSFGLAAVDENSDDIVGYAVLRLIIRYGGTELGMAMAPLYANNVSVAKLLLRAAAQECIANRAVPKTRLQLLYPVGDNCGVHAAQLMEDLEAEVYFEARRVYNKGHIPSGRKLEKIYGITSTTFD